MNRNWTDDAWEDYLYWQEKDRKILRKINRLIEDINRHPFSGLGKPEMLKGDLSGCWSRQIDKKNRIVYYVEDDGVLIIQCRTHYREH